MNPHVAPRLFSGIVFFSLIFGWNVLPVFNSNTATLQAEIKDPKVRKSVQRGVGFLKKEIAKTSQGYRSLAAYALVKAGEPVTSPAVTAVLKKIQEKIKDGEYEAEDSHYAVYESAVDLMLLAETPPGKYDTELKVIAKHLADQQSDAGYWNYDTTYTHGDTSITQYAILGLWAAHRRGIEVPLRSFDKAAKWHLETQKNGGYGYQPKNKASTAPTLNMTMGGTGSMLVIQRILYSGEPIKKEKKDNKNPFLKKVSLDGKDKKKNSNINFKPTIPNAALVKSIDAGSEWSDRQFRVKYPDPHPTRIRRMYYYYALERFGALADIKKLNGDDWFAVCRNELLRTQEKDGGWKSGKTPVTGTSFAILFLSQSTAKLLGRPIGKQIGTGLLAGGRGLPDNLDDVRMKGGKIDTKKSNDPLAELLTELEKPGSKLIDSVQVSVVEKIQIGDPEVLIGQRERLVKLVSNKNPEVRRVAFWALGRGGNLSDARLMVDALKDEDNVDVLTEVRNALCFMSHKVNGFGLSTSPLSGISEDATQQQKNQTMKKWKATAHKKWLTWYLKVRPYNEKNDILELSIQR